MAALKLECDVCKLKFRNEEETIEHYSSLSHHIKRSRELPSSKLLCVLCNMTYENLADYSRHIDGEDHAKSLQRFRQLKETAAKQVSQFSRKSINEQASTSSFPRYFSSASFGQFSAASSQDTSPPWCPPNLPQKLVFRSTATNFAEDSFPESMDSFFTQPPPQPSLDVHRWQPPRSDFPSPRNANFFRSLRPPRPLFPRPLFPSKSSFPENRAKPSTSDGHQIATASVQQPRQIERSPPFHFQAPRRVLIQNPSVIEPVVPMDVRNLGHNERINPSTLFTKQKQRAEHIRAKLDGCSMSASAISSSTGKKKKKKGKKTPKVAKEAEGTVKKKRRRLSKPFDLSVISNLIDQATGTTSISSTDQSDQSKQRSEADSTTAVDDSSARRSVLLAAAILKRRRLSLAKSQNLSDRLLADRLNRFRLVAAAGSKRQESSNEAASANSDVISGNLVSSDNTIPSVEEADHSTRIDVHLRQRARDLFIQSTSASGNSTNTPTTTNCVIQPSRSLSVPGVNLRTPKAEVDATPPRPTPSLISYSQDRSPSFSPFPVVEARASGSEARTPGKDEPTQVAVLQQLWRLCKEEETIRIEQANLNEEMERLKQELRRVWYRQKELEQMAEECAKKKKTLLGEGISGDKAA